jgi:hypothetical protein
MLCMDCSLVRRRALAPLYQRKKRVALPPMSRPRVTASRRAFREALRGGIGGRGEGEGEGVGLLISVIYGQGRGGGGREGGRDGERTSEKQRAVNGIDELLRGRAQRVGASREATNEEQL